MIRIIIGKFFEKLDSHKYVDLTFTVFTQVEVTTAANVGEECMYTGSSRSIDSGDQKRPVVIMLYIPADLWAA